MKSFKLSLALLAVFASGSTGSLQAMEAAQTASPGSASKVIVQDPREKLNDINAQITAKKTELETAQKIKSVIKRQKQLDLLRTQLEALNTEKNRVERLVDFAKTQPKPASAVVEQEQVEQKTSAHLDEEDTLPTFHSPVKPTTKNGEADQNETPARTPEQVKAELAAMRQQEAARQERLAAEATPASTPAKDATPAAEENVGSPEDSGEGVPDVQSDVAKEKRKADEAEAQRKEKEDRDKKDREDKAKADLADAQRKEEKRKADELEVQRKEQERLAEQAKEQKRVADAQKAKDAQEMADALEAGREAEVRRKEQEKADADKKAKEEAGKSEDEKKRQADAADAKSSAEQKAAADAKAKAEADAATFNAYPQAKQRFITDFNKYAKNHLVKEKLAEYRKSHKAAKVLPEAELSDINAEIYKLEAADIYDALNQNVECNKLKGNGYINYIRNYRAAVRADKKAFSDFMNNKVARLGSQYQPYLENVVVGYAEYANKGKIGRAATYINRRTLTRIGVVAVLAAVAGYMYTKHKN
jgi:hypothetical protein